MRFLEGLLALGAAAPAVYAAFVSAAPIHERGFDSIETRGVTDIASVLPRAGVTKENTASDWDNIIAGKATCQPVGIIFARGTFDEGNIGIWVGSFFFIALRKALPKGVAYQGVTPAKYPATLGDYLKQTGGSNDGAEEMARQITAYLKYCKPKIKGDIVIIISAWSQGAIVAHKAIKTLADVEHEDVANIFALVAFGDPNNLWEKINVPSTIEVPPTTMTCIGGTYPDLLCQQKLPKLPTSLAALKDPWTSPPSVVPDGSLKKAIIATGKQLLAQLPSNFMAFLRQMGFRIMLLPQHFMYGSNGMADSAAQWVAKLPKVVAAAK